MNTAQIKAYAPQARKDFIAAVTYKANSIGISEKEIIEPEIKGDIAIIGGLAFSKKIIEPRNRLIKSIKIKGFDQIMEEAAYTWFNRFVALRYMELHDYLDHGFRVLSTSSDSVVPEILEQAANVALPGLDKEKVIELRLAGDKDNELFRMLLIAQCNAMHQSMPFLFPLVNQPDELLLPDNLLHTNSPIQKMVGQIDEDAWNQVEIIGWIYQFYISEKKDQVIGKVVKSEDIPAATQLFTPNWIVKYMVQNSLGRKWLDTYPDSPLQEKMEYYIKPAEQDPKVQAQLDAITPKELNPEEITFMDPACGSGHILVEAYDIFKEIYLERGYRKKDIPKLILEKNLYGLDICDRAVQLTRFALLMRAREDDRRILGDNNPDLNILAIQSSKGLDATNIARALTDKKGTPLIGEDDLFPETRLQKPLVMQQEVGFTQHDIIRLLDIFQDAKTFGSLIRIPEDLSKNLDVISKAAQGVIGGGDIFLKPAVEQIKPFVMLAQYLSSKYNVVVTNPPYLGGGCIPRLKNFLKDYYTDVKSDLFSAFMVRNTELALPNGHLGFMSPFVWMFISSYEKLRTYLIDQKTITSLVQLEYSGFDGATVPICTFTLKNAHNPEFKGGYIRLSDFRGSENQGPKTLEAINDHNCGWFFRASAINFQKIPGSPIAYWISDSVISIFSNSPQKIGDIANPNQALVTGSTDTYIRKWYEVALSRIGFGFNNREDAKNSNKKWFPYNKGGDFRNWYGNNEHVVDWQNDGYRLQTTMHPSGNRIWAHNFVLDSIFNEALVWSKITSAKPCFRYSQNGFLYDDASGVCSFDKGMKELLIGLLCSKVNYLVQKLINPTLNIQPANLRSVPLPYEKVKGVSEVVNQIISLSMEDWDSYEKSWGIEQLPLLCGQWSGISSQKEREQSNYTWPLSIPLREAYTKLREDWQERTKIMQCLEEKNNRIFIEAYGLEDEMSPDVSLKKITLTCNPHYRYKGNKSQEELEALLQADTIKELISYAIGCMMGRYSLDEPGLIYAHSGNDGFDSSRYKIFPADDDGIIPIMDKPWFDDNAANRFVEFLKVAWSPETLDENLEFVADSIAPKKNNLPMDIITQYLSRSFFKDHLKTYKKRPIYWLFSSGKLKAFECLVYLHRYNKSTLSRIRSFYVTPLQGKFNGRLEFLKNEIANAETASAQKKAQKELDALKKKQVELAKFDEELRHYADKQISLDLDYGVKVNYGKFGNLLAETKAITGIK